VVVIACGEGRAPSSKQNGGAARATDDRPEHPAGTCQRPLPTDNTRDFCHTLDDCKQQGGHACTATGSLPSCKGGVPRSACKNDGDCSPGDSAGAGGSGLPLVCQDEGAGNFYCAPPCIEETDCPSTYLCEVTTGHCKPPLCDDENPCSEGTFCAGGACQRQVCACDTECGASGYCVRGQCQESPGYCVDIACGRPLVIGGLSAVARLTSRAWA
jgi:hypothetical protein